MTTESLEGLDLPGVARLTNATLLQSGWAAWGSLMEQVRLTSLSLPYTGTWLNAVPSPALGLYLRNPEFVTALKYRLGANIYRALPSLRCPQWHTWRPCPLLRQCWSGRHKVRGRRPEAEVILQGQHWWNLQLNKCAKAIKKTFWGQDWLNKKNYFKCLFALIKQCMWSQD